MRPDEDGVSRGCGKHLDVLGFGTGDVKLRPEQVAIEIVDIDQAIVV